MRKTTYLSSFLFCLGAASTEAIATPVTTPVITFGTLPASGSISGPAGATIGWGYTATNDDPSLWVSIDSVNTSTGFTDGTFDTNNFDFPVIAPGATVTQSFSANTSGLAEFTWNSGAPSSAVNSGTFYIGISWYTEDPVTCGFTCTYTGFAESLLTTDYAVSIATASATPEPTTCGLLLIGLAISGRAWRRR